MTLVDTSFLIDLMRGDAGAVRLATLWTTDGDPVYVPAVVLHELHRGLARSQLPIEEWTRLRRALAGLVVLEMDAETARLAGQIDGALAAAGLPIEAEDCMIAGIALRHALPVITRNVADFGRVTGLQVQAY